MKNSKLLIFLSALCLSSVLKVGAEEKPTKKAEVKVLILGLSDNVKSNYYYEASIAEATGINEDSIVTEFNRIIAGNIEDALPKSTCKFLAASKSGAADSILSKIECIGEAEQANSNLTALPATIYQGMLDKADAKYMLVLNQHYLKRQDQPMRTVFHIVSYTLYDEDRKEVFKGNQFFTSIKLESADKIKVLSRKTAAKIAFSVAKVLEH